MQVKDSSIQYDKNSKVDWANAQYGVTETSAAAERGVNGGSGGGGGDNGQTFAGQQRSLVEQLKHCKLAFSCIRCRASLLQHTQ